jgi:hypothetical protein
MTRDAIEAAVATLARIGKRRIANLRLKSDAGQESKNV